MPSSAVTEFDQYCLSRPGTHLCTLGTTGSGKTTFLYWVIDALLAHDEIITWVDTGKPGELLPLAQMRPLNVLVPRGCEMRITLNPGITLKHSITLTEFNTLADVWKMLRRDSINVIAFKRFITDPLVSTRACGKLFSDLIEAAYDYQLPTPLAVIIDELQDLAPSTGNAKNTEHYAIGAILQQNIELIRSQKVRLIAGLQGWNKTRPGIRMEVNCWAAKTGADFSHEVPNLHAFVPLFMSLKRDEVVLIDQQRHFRREKVRVPYYRPGTELGEVRYIGKWITGLEREFDWGNL